MLYRCLITLVAFTIVSSAAFAEILSEQKLQLIAETAYRGVGFSSSPKDLRQLLPNAELNGNHPGSDRGILTYEVTDDQIIDCVLLRFVDDALIEIQYIYFPTTVARMGGAGPITALAVAEYGEPTKRIGRRLIWDFPSIDRTVVVSTSRGKWSQQVVHRSRRNSTSNYVETSAAPSAPKIMVTGALAAPNEFTITRSVPAKPKTKNSVAADSLTKYEINARDFGYGRIRIGIDRSVLGFRYTPALGDQREGRRHGDHLHFGGRLPADMGVVTYVVERGKNRRLVLGFQYGRLVFITDVREQLQLSRVADLEKDQSAAIAKFGSDIHLKDGRNLTWNFKSVNRKVDYRVINAKDRTQTVSLRASLLHLNLP